MRISDWSSDVCSSDLFDSKDAIFRALVRDMSGQVRDPVAPVLATEADQLSAERAGLLEFIEVVRGNKERQSVGWGKSVSVRVDLVGSRCIKNTNTGIYKAEQRQLT